MDQRTRKLMTMHRALHPRHDVNRLYISRKEGGRGLASIGDSVDASIQRLEDYIEKHEVGLIKATRNDNDNTKTNRMTITIPFPVQNGSSSVQNGNSSFENENSSVQNKKFKIKKIKFINIFGATTRYWFVKFF